MAIGQEARLSAELEFYASHKAEWLKQSSGKYVVVKGNQVLDFYSNFEEAYRAAVAVWGIDTDFLVKQIVEQEPAFFVF